MDEGNSQQCQKGVNASDRKTDNEAKTLLVRNSSILTDHKALVGV